MTVTLTTRYVSEREFVYSPTVLGFPSIQGCHAIVYVTDSGLFGYHNVGGETAAQYNDRATAFGNFVTGHPSGGSTGRAVYGACFLTGKQAGATSNFLTSRAYGGQARGSWIAELSAFADAVHLNGPIYGCDLGKSPALPGKIIPSAYVEFTRVGAKCVTQVKVWNDSDATKGAVTDHVNIQYNTSKAVVENQTSKTITKVNSAGMRTTYPESLR